MSTALSRDIVTARFMFNAIKESGPNVGDYKWSGKEDDFNGWKLCDGRLLRRDAYPELFDILGTKHDTGVAITHFRLPDCRSRTIMASQNTSGDSTVPALGAGLTARNTGITFGEETHTLTIPEMPSHNHPSNAVGGNGNVGLMTSDGSNTVNSDTNGSTSGEPSLTVPPVALSIDNTGGGGAHNNLQPNIVVGSVFVYAGRPLSPPFDGPDDTEYLV